MKYYELYYFRGRRDTGSIYIKTELNLDDFIDEDDFLDALISEGKLTYLEADEITSIDEIDYQTYVDMVGHE